jgi:hypothetical protein
MSGMSQTGAHVCMDNGVGAGAFSGAIGVLNKEMWTSLMRAIECTKTTDNRCSHVPGDWLLTKCPCPERVLPTIGHHTYSSVCGSVEPKPIHDHWLTLLILNLKMDATCTSERYKTVSICIRWEDLRTLPLPYTQKPYSCYYVAYLKSAFVEVTNMNTRCEK